MFEKYPTEAKKIYEFSIGVAGELPEGFEDSLKHVQSVIALHPMGAGKKTSCPKNVP